jgi:hypothetical protein
MQTMIVFATHEETKHIVWGTKATPTLARASQTIHHDAIIAVNANFLCYCTSTRAPQAAACIPDASVIHCWGLRWLGGQIRRRNSLRRGEIIMA